MIGQRVTRAAAERLRDRLSERDWAIIHSLAQTRVLTGQQLSRLHFVELSPLTQHRIRRRVLERLTNWHVVSRLDRVIGGVRAGSTGWVFALGAAGQRLLHLDANQHRSVERIRQPWTPSLLFLRHSLDIAELYVQLVEAARFADFAVSSFNTEPACWWPDGLGGAIKPDAHVVLTTDQFDELFWLEVDRGSESLPTLHRKLASYVDFVRRGQLGPSGVMPHVVVSAPTEHRAANIRDMVERLDPDGNILHITTFESASAELIALATAAPEVPP